MPVIAGNQLWRIKSVTVPPASTVVVAHELQANNAIGLQPNEIWIIPVPPLPAVPGWEQISIGAITSTTAEFTNNTSGEGGATITINVLFVMPHTIIGPGTNDGYV
jgi:hypothetical protein